MPRLTVQTNIADDKITDDLIRQLSAKVAQLLSKPEQYVAVHVQAGQRLSFGGTHEPAALIELVSIGLPSDQTATISNALMSLLEDNLHIKADRMFLKFNDVAGNMMGWNKGTF